MRDDSDMNITLKGLNDSTTILEVYLTKGLSIVLGFIGVKLIIEAFHGIGIHTVFGLHIPEISLPFSLTFIIGTLTITAIASLIVSSKSKVAE